VSVPTDAILRMLFRYPNASARLLAMSDGTRTQRRLAAIVSADVVGYSRLMGMDEAGTLAAMCAHRAELWYPTIEKHGGRVVGTAGDGTLFEYASAVAAVESAVVVQKGMVERNAHLPADRQMLIRIGVNIGEVIVEEGGIYGDGVNVAARVQALASPGGVAISDIVHGQVRDKVDVVFEDGGIVEMKNIVQPVRVWHWPAAQQAVGDEAAKSAAAPALSDKPAIAVLPFENMSTDPDQEFFSDGITEDVITELSRFRALMVIARNSTFTYKGRSVNVQEIGRELAVRYVVEGSVRKVGNRVRITAQLVEAESGSHVWAEHYDRDLTDIFAVQDEITQSVVSAIAPGVVAAEEASARRKAPENLSAWECVVRGTTHMLTVSREDFDAAAALFDQAIRLDPNYALAHSMTAYLKVWRAYQGWSGRILDEMAGALASAQRAVDLDPRDAVSQYVTGFVHMLGRHPDRALGALRKSIDLNPNSADGHGGLGMALAYSGVDDAALEALDTALRLNPRGLEQPMLIAYRAMVHLLAGRNVEATRLAKESITQRQDFVVSHLVLAAALGHLDRSEEGREAAAKILNIYPKFSLTRHERWVPIVHTEDRARYLEGLRKVGLPE